MASKQTLHNVTKNIFLGIGATLVIIGIIIFKVSIHNQSFTEFAVSLVFCFIGAFVMRLGKRIAMLFLQKSISYEDLFKEAQRNSNILYLRNFTEDFWKSRGKRDFLKIIHPVAFYFDDETEEDELVEIIKPYGNVICLRDPSDFLPYTGAVNYKINDDNIWKEFITTSIVHCKFILLFWSDTKGIKFEIETVIEKKCQEKLIIVIDSTDKLNQCQRFLTTHYKKLSQEINLSDFKHQENFSVIYFEGNHIFQKHVLKETFSGYSDLGDAITQRIRKHRAHNKAD